MAKSETTAIELLIIGGSAGSLQVIFQILAGIPSDFHLPILLVVHRHPQESSLLSSVLATKTNLKVKEIEDKDEISSGVLYVCPPDYHVLIESDKTFSLDYSEKVHFSRPSIDVAFFSASEIYGPALMGILLSGGNADGAEGLAVIQARGGTTIVQHPDEAEVSYMPEQALLHNKADFVLSTAAMIKLLKSVK